MLNKVVVVVEVEKIENLYVYNQIKKKLVAAKSLNPDPAAHIGM